ncbi:MAG: RNA polymerase sigma factor, partial [Pyrinomonadaceae bacterium]
MSFQDVPAQIRPGGKVASYLDSERITLEPKSLMLDGLFIQLFEQWRNSVYRYLMAVYGNAGDAEELTQEAFLRLYRCLRGGQVVNNPRSWIFRVAHNLAIDRYKSEKHVTPLDRDCWEELCNRQDPSQNPE